MCHHCGKLGHKARFCPNRGGTATSEMGKAVKDQADRADGAIASAKEFKQDLDELRAKHEEEHKRMEKAEEELARRVALGDAQALALIEKLKVSVSAGFWMPPMDMVVAMTMFLVLMWYPSYGWTYGQESDWWHSLHDALASLLRLLLFSYFCVFGVMYYRAGRLFCQRMCIEFVRHVNSGDHADMRPDANTLQEVRHRNPLFIEVAVRARAKAWWGRDRVTRYVISAELLAQLRAPRLVNPMLSEASAYDAIMRAATTNQTVNWNRYRDMVAASVPVSTAMVAMMMWQMERDSLIEAGFLPPRGS